MSQAKPKSVTTLNDTECMLEFKEGTQMVDVKRSLELMENWLGMLAQVWCTMSRPKQFKTLHHRRHYYTTSLVPGNNKVGTHSLLIPPMGFWGVTLKIPLELVRPMVRKHQTRMKSLLIVSYFRLGRFKIVFQASLEGGCNKVIYGHCC